MTNEIMETALCGCKIRRTPEGQFYVDWCSMHTAAPILLEACQTALAEVWDGETTSDYLEVRDALSASVIRDKCRAAIAAATQDNKPMSKITPSPLPWTACGTLVFGGFKPGIGSYAVAQTFMADETGLPVTGELEQMANRDFIVRCVNCHNDLLEACQAARQVLRDLAHNPAFEDDAPEFNAGGIPYKTIGQLVIAIDKATQDN